MLLHKSLFISIASCRIVLMGLMKYIVVTVTIIAIITGKKGLNKTNKPSRKSQPDIIYSTPAI